MKPQRPQRNTLRTLKEYPFKDITEKIISCAIEVHSSLGPGLLENLYEEAMEHELKSRGIVYKRQKELEIKYKGNPIGNYRLDYLIENKVIVELKCVEAIKGIHIAQVLTYLKAENLRVGLLINFNVDKLKEGIRRVIL
ncbi:MAG: GxxExxY protein [Calditrichia bacterium]|nr:GxxExxY protein [Calditrichia bacterium]